MVALMSLVGDLNHGQTTDMTSIVINWGSTNFRAYLLDDRGTLLDEVQAASGVSGLSRGAMVEIIADVSKRWPHASRVIASGMIGSNVGWVEAPYRTCPARIADIGQGSVGTDIGGVRVEIIPGLTCTAPHGLPDVMRGEEVELSGAVSLLPAEQQQFVALPGTHTKWACLNHDMIEGFFTSMVGEMFDRMTREGLLASITDGQCAAGPEFFKGVERGYRSGLSLGTLLFSARALVVRDTLARTDSGSYLRGLLIGTEIRDAIALYPALLNSAVTLVGSAASCAFYQEALKLAGVNASFIDARDAALAGYTAIIGATTQETAR